MSADDIPSKEVVLITTGMFTPDTERMNRTTPMTSPTRPNILIVLTFDLDEFLLIKTPPLFQFWIF